MNPASATLRSIEICAALNVAERSFYRWFAHPYPLHQLGGKARWFALPETVTRLRDRRQWGLFGEDLARLVDIDTLVRAERAYGGMDDLWLGAHPETRACAFYEALTGEERERARLFQKSVSGAAIDAGLPRVERLRNITLIHPATVRYFLTGEGDELPVGDAGWRAWVKAADVVNIPETENERLVA